MFSVILERQCVPGRFHKIAAYAAAAAVDTTSNGLRPAHASDPQGTLPSLPNAAPSGFPQALPEGEVLARLRRFVRKTCSPHFSSGR